MSKPDKITKVLAETWMELSYPQKVYLMAIVVETIERFKEKWGQQHQTY